VYVKNSGNELGMYIMFMTIRTWHWNFVLEIVDLYMLRARVSGYFELLQYWKI